MRTAYLIIDDGVIGLYAFAVHSHSRQMGIAWMLTRLNSLWVGDQLGYLEQLCLVSAMSVGHGVTLYTYTPESISGVPTGVELRDAREVMAEEKLVSYSDSGSFSLGSNFFRYELLSKGLGYWVDMDFLFIRPLDFKGPYVFGWQDSSSINSALLHIPPNCAMARELREIPQPNRRPPWFGPKRSLLYYWNRLTRGTIKVEDLPWGTYGPRMVTYLAKKNNVAGYAEKPSVFYPVTCQNARLLYGPAELIDRMISPDTYAVHMWHSALFGLSDKPPPEGSYIDVACRRHGIEIDKGLPLTSRY